MKTIRESLDGLRRELEAALADQPGVRLSADRVRVTLQLALSKQGVWSALSGPVRASEVGHQIEVEFRVANRPSEERTRTVLEEAPLTASPLELTGEAAQQVVEQLSKFFGAPGFDSSARATVFREALDGVSLETILEAVRTLPDPKAPKEPSVRQVRHRLSGLVRSGPVGSPSKAVPLLNGIFRGYDLGQVLRLVLATWKTQDEWM